MKQRPYVFRCIHKGVDHRDHAPPNLGSEHLTLGSLGFSVVYTYAEIGLWDLGDSIESEFGHSCLI